MLAANPEDAEALERLASCERALGRPAEAAAIWEKLIRPGSGRFRDNLAGAYVDLAEAARTPDDKLALYQKAMAQWAALLAFDPDDPGSHHGIAGAANTVGTLLSKKGRTKEALGLYRLAAAHYEEAHREAPYDLLTAYNLAVAQANVGLALGDTPEAVAPRRRALEIRRRIVRDNPSASMRAHLGPYVDQTLHLARLLFELKRPDEALSTIRETRAALEELAHDGRPDILIQLARIRAYHAHGLREDASYPSPALEAEHRAGLDAAAAALRLAIAAGLRDRARLQKEPHLVGLLERADVKETLAQAEALARAEAEATRAGAAPEAKLAAAQRTLDLRRGLAAAGPSNVNVRGNQAAALHGVGLAQADLGRTDEARRSLEKALAIRRQLAEALPNQAPVHAEVLATRTALAELEWKAGRLAEGLQAYRAAQDALATARTALPRDEMLAAKAAELDLAVGRMYRDLGLWSEAAGSFRRALDAAPAAARVWDREAYARLLLLSGDEAGYRRACAATLARHGQEWERAAVVRTALQRPGAVPDPKALVPVAAQVRAAAPKDGWHVLFLALAHLRAGQAAEASARLAEFERVSKGKWQFSWPALALGLHQTGKPGEAREWLRKTERWYAARWADTLERGRLGFPRDGDWYYWSIFLLFRQEATEAVTGQAAPADVWQQLHRGLVYAKLGDEQRSEAELRAAAAARPDDPEVFRLRGRVYGLLGRPERGAEDLARAVDLFAKGLDAVRPEDRGAARAAAARWDDVFAELSKRRPRDAGLWLARGGHLAASGDRAGAARAFAQAAATFAEGAKTGRLSFSLAEAGVGR